MVFETYFLWYKLEGEAVIDCNTIPNLVEHDHMKGSNKYISRSPEGQDTNHRK